MSAQRGTAGNDATPQTDGGGARLRVGLSIAALSAAGCQLFGSVKGFDDGPAPPEGAGDAALDAIEEPEGGNPPPLEGCLHPAKPEQWVLLHDARWTDDPVRRIVLTPGPADPSHSGTGTDWCTRPIDLSAKPELTFDLNLGSRDFDGGNGAGGRGIWLIFVAADADAGWPTSFLGTSRAFAVEFDTFADEYTDPPAFDASAWMTSEDHIALVAGGAIQHDVGLPWAIVGNFEDGYDHGVSLRWEEAGSVMQVSLRNPTTSAWVNVLNSDVSDLITSVLGTSIVYYGFVGMVSDEPDWNVQSVVP